MQHHRSRHQPTALLVDDDAMMRLIAAQTLGQAGFHVVQAEDGETAIALFEQQHPDIVLMDVIMPGIDGYEAVKRIRALPGGTHVPVLMLTGLDDLESINRAYEAGATDFVSKPINWAILGHRVRYMLRAADATFELIESQSFLANAQRLAKLGSWSWNLNTNIALWSDLTYEILGYAKGGIEANLASFINRLHVSERERAEQEIKGVLDTGVASESTYLVLLDEGKLRYINTHTELGVDEQGRPESLRGSIQDVTDQRLAQERIRTLAYYDGLTHLPNRHHFLEHVTELIERARRAGNAMGILSMDLDQFKRINDTLGHTVGDQLLVDVANRLRECVRSDDPMVTLPGRTTQGNVIDLARLGGDEFCVALPRLTQAGDAAKIARRIIDAFSAPFALPEGQEVFVTTSIGVSVFPQDGEDAEALLKNADAAMYFAKAQGRNNFQYYGRKMNSRSLEKLAMESQLRRAIERDEFVLHYQPKLDLESGLITGAEALVRWQHPELGMVPPMEFIPIAEETGLIIPIGEWVLHAATKQNHAWQIEGISPIHVAVNIASPHFRQRGFVANVAKALTETSLSAKWLELEVTESMLMDDLATTLSTLSELKEMGLRLAIDDFGTGYSSLSYLKRFPLDALKIDRSFVKDTPDAADDTAITTAVIAMAHSLKLEVVAEGVETQAQLEFLKAHRCEFVQGYLISKPLPAAQFRDLIVDHSALKIA